MDEKYWIIISAVSANRHTLEDAGIRPNVEEFAKAFARLPISSPINFHTGYDQKILHEDSQENMAFQTMQGRYQPINTHTGSYQFGISICQSITGNTEHSRWINVGNIRLPDRNERPKQSV
jgi:hypothetical protein